MDFGMAPEKLFAGSISALILVASPMFSGNSAEKLFLERAKIDKVED